MVEYGPGGSKYDKNRLTQSLRNKGYVDNYKPMGLGDYLILTSKLITFAKKNNVKIISHYMKVKGMHHHEELGDKWVDSEYVDWKLYSDVNQYYDAVGKYKLLDLKYHQGWAKLNGAQVEIPKTKYITYSFPEISNTFTKRNHRTIKKEQKDSILNTCKNSGYKVVDIGSFKYSILEKVSLLNNSSFHLTSNTGIAHLASCQNIPTILYYSKYVKHIKLLQNTGSVIKSFFESQNNESRFNSELKSTISNI